jgi:Protein of unknown function DUF115
MKVPYSLTPAVHIHKRHAHMAVALHYGFPRLQQVPIDDTKTLSVACYGPSLLDTWQDIKPPIMSMSGSLHFLAERGIIPDYHVDMDPRENKLQDISNPVVDGVHYIMASVCPTGTWELLKGQKVTIWHVYSGKDTYDWVAANDKGQLVIHGGSTIGLTALHVGGVMGFRHFEIHGMDGSFKDSTRTVRHAGPHSGHTQNKHPITWDAGGKTYYSSKIMANAVAETINQIANFPMFTVFHGEGLTQALVKERNAPNSCCADETEKAATVRKATAIILDALIDDPHASTPETRCARWDKLYGPPLVNCLSDMTVIAAYNESRRLKAKYNTGTITVEQMVQLRQLTHHLKPSVAVEVGTFIGNSTMAIKVDKVYTCDRDNDCFPATRTIEVFPGQSSTAMFLKLLERKVSADLFFFDGRLPAKDVDLILALSHPGTVYVFDDYNGNKKGIANARLLLSTALAGRDVILLEPDDRVTDSTLAAIVPRALLNENRLLPDIQRQPEALRAG